ncbi:ankyrin and het domain protein [Colletotrichum kahawae]|uniref:Ankyrin and het domain protein n=1 Tax=Colletotrichum kahawae TaxID=34407 RepID=A0AAD9YSK1_COLKA|nr:ankyrin and het domain protein [Colletotrichum kahawae]
MADNTRANSEYTSEDTSFDSGTRREHPVSRSGSQQRRACVLWETVAYCSDFLYDGRLYEQLSEMLYENNPPVKSTHPPWRSITSSAVPQDYLKTGRRKTKCARALLFLMLRLTCGVEASEPKDHVFGLMAILNLLLDISSPERTEIQPHYRACSTSVSVFIDTAGFILEECSELTLLTAVPDDAVKKISSLLSWVPDFAASGLFAFIGMRRRSGEAHFDVCRSVPADFRIVDNNAFSHTASPGLQKELHQWIADHVVWEVYCATKKGADLAEHLTRLESIRRLADSDVSRTVPDHELIKGYLQKLEGLDT